MNLEGLRKVIIEPILEESCQTCRQMFGKLKERGLKTPALVISDAPSGLAAAIRKRFPGACRQRCKAHFMRNILAHIPRFLCQRVKVKEIWLAPAAAGARERAAALCGKYATRYPKAIETLENSLEDSLTFYAFPQPDHRKIALTSMLERLNKEIRRWISVIGIFPDSDSCVRLMTTTDGTIKVQCYLRFLCASGDRLSYRVFRGLVGLSCLHLKAFSGGYNSCCIVNPFLGFPK